MTRSNPNSHKITTRKVLEHISILFALTGWNIFAIYKQLLNHGSLHQITPIIAFSLGLIVIVLFLIFNERARKASMNKYVRLLTLSILIILFIGGIQDTFNPLEHIDIYIANFDTPNPKEARIEQAIYSNISEALKPYDFITVSYLNKTITPQNKTTIISQTGKGNVSIVIWGWVGGGTNTPVSVSLETINSSIFSQPPIPSYYKGGTFYTTPHKIATYQLQLDLADKLSFFTSTIIGYALIEHGDIQKGIDIINHALDLVENHNTEVDKQTLSSIYTTLSRAKYYLSQLDISLIKEAINLDPSNIGAHQLAAQYYTSAIGIQTALETATNFTSLADISKSMKELRDKALYHISTIIELTKGLSNLDMQNAYVLALTNKALILAEVNNSITSEVNDILEQITQIAPNSGLSDYVKAMATFRKAMFNRKFYEYFDPKLVSRDSFHILQYLKQNNPTSYGGYQISPQTKSELFQDLAEMNLDYLQSINYINNAIRQNPRRLAYRWLRSIVFQTLGLYDLAIKDLNYWLNDPSTKSKIDVNEATRRLSVNTNNIREAENNVWQIYKEKLNERYRLIYFDTIY